jgi:hypothetical protein
LNTGGDKVEDNVAYSEKYNPGAAEWYPYRPGDLPDEQAGEDAFMMWEFILRDFLASLPLED